MTCKTCIFWDHSHSWIEEVPIEIQYVADCAESRVAHCRRNAPQAFLVPDPDSKKGFKILSIFPATAHDTFCGEYVEDVNRMRSKV